MLKKITKLLGIGLTIAMLTSLLAVAAPASADVSQPTVAFGSGADNDISKAGANMTVSFKVNQQLSVNDTISVTFPTATTLTAITANIAAGSGLFNGAYLPVGAINNVAANWTLSADQKTAIFTMGAADQIGAGAQVWINFTAGVQNPAAIGDYTLMVYTSKETNPVASVSYSIDAPYVAPLSGVVTVKNSAGVILAQYTGSNAIKAALLDPKTTLGCVLEVSDGTYNDTIAGATIPLNVGGITIKATGSAAIVVSNWLITTAAVDTFGNPVNTVIDGLILQPAAKGGTILNIANTANNTVIQNVTLKKATVAPNTQLGTTTALVVVAAGATVADHNVTFTNCSFDTTDGAVVDKSIMISDGPVVIDTCSFMVDASTAFVNDTAVMVTGVNADTKASALTIKNSTITGSSGVGVDDSEPTNATSVTLTGNTFDTLAKAVYMNSANGTLSMTGNTVMNSTASPVATIDTATAAIDLMKNKSASLQKNTIKDNNGLAVRVDAGNAGVAAITFIGNSLSGNKLGTVNKNLGTTLMAELNFWGDNSGPTDAVSNPGGTGDPVVPTTPTKYGTVDYIPWANTSSTQVAAGLTVAAGGTVDKSTTVGITYTNTNGVAPTAGVALMKYSGNPAPVATPAPALDGGFYDVYSPNAVAGGGTITVLFYNANINSDTKAYYYSTLQKEWVMCSSQAVAGNSAYVYVSIFPAVGASGASTPAPTDLNGTVFALVNKKTIPNSPVINTPSIGATDVSIEPMFTWGAVTGAVRYELSVADDPSFTFLTFSHNVEGITFYKADAANEEALSYDTTYYWRVRAILDNTFAASTPATAYTVGIFTTMAEPSTTGGQVIEVNPTTPQVNVDIPPTQITVEPSGSSIPTYILWIIVVIGAILIIALIVLIVRTRRVA